jgi:hypothetical protein
MTIERRKGMEEMTSNLNTIWRSCVRRGQTAAEADVIIESIVRELDEGDSDLFEFFLEHAKLDIH